MAATLYADAEQKHYFLVPDELTLPTGPLVLRSLTGRRLTVDPEAAAPHEIPEEDAKKMAQELVGAFAEKLKVVAMSAVEALSRAPAADPAATVAREERVAASLKTSREALRDDPEQLKSALKGIFQGILAAAKETVHTPDVAKDRMKDIAEALRQEGVASGAPEIVESLPDRIREVLGSKETLDKLDELTRDLEQATADLKAERTRRE